MGDLLDVLAPNALLKEKYREGWRSCEVKRRRMLAPRDLHRVGDAVAALRSLARRAFVGLGPVGACVLQFKLFTDRALDDDGWLFLPKPVVDGMTDAGFWAKDRRRIVTLAGSVNREVPAPGDRLNVRVVYP